MNPIETIGAFVANASLATLPERLHDGVALHVFDAIGAALAGGAVAETIDVRDLVQASYGPGPALALGSGVHTSVPAAAMLGAVAARCSEIDDIHIRSCITPGSIIVPAAIAVASTLERVDGATLLAACAAGSEVLIRFGLAVDGPRVLYRGIWPTYVCAGFGVAATVARLLALDAAQTADALAIAATLAVGTTGRPPGKTSRWLTMGCAVQNGVLAALAAQRGMRGDTNLIGTTWSDITGIALEPAALIEDLRERFEIAEASLKPWCAAKQTVAATDAFRTLVADERIDASSVQRVEVAVPAAYRAMIDRGTLPANRHESFASVQYQLALATFAPDRAYDVVRATIDAQPEVRRLVERTTVIADPALDPHYPAAWPARVTVVDGAGTVFSSEVLHPLGDPGTRFGWDAVSAKLERSTGLPAAAIAGLAAACRSLADAGSLDDLLRSAHAPDGVAV